jgi:hypothetical protein
MRVINNTIQILIINIDCFDKQKFENDINKRYFFTIVNDMHNTMKSLFLHDTIEKQYIISFLGSNYNS